MTVGSDPVWFTLPGKTPRPAWHWLRVGKFTVDDGGGEWSLPTVALRRTAALRAIVCLITFALRKRGQRIPGKCLEMWIGTEQRWSVVDKEISCSVSLQANLLWEASLDKCLCLYSDIIWRSDIIWTMLPLGHSQHDEIIRVGIFLVLMGNLCSVSFR